MLNRVCTLGLLALLAFTAATVAVRADDIKVDDPDVTVLTDSNYHSFVQADLALVEFYAPWCGHCKSLAPEYAVAATQLKQDGTGIVLGKVDATVHRGHGVEIKGYPTLKIFRNGKMSDYNGPRKADGIVSYMKKQMGPAARTVSTQAELDALLMQDPAVQYAIVAFFPSEGKASQLSSSFSILANRMRDEFAFGRSTDAALAASQGVPAGGEALVAYLRGEKTVYTGSSKTGDVEAWIRENSLPLVGEFNDATASIYHARNLPIAKLFINVDKSPKGASSKTMTYYTNRLKKIANKFSGRILVAYADKQEQKNAFEALNFEPEDVNTFAIEEPREGKWYKYEEEEDDEEEEEALQKSKDGKAKKKVGLDVEGWSHLVEDYLAGDATAYVKSQKAPKDNLTRPVKIATGNNFDDLINQDDKDVLIEFYAPWCGHCRALEPKYEKLGEQVLKDASLKETIIAKIDATANEYDRQAWEVSGYPTIFFKPAGKKAVKYEGAREVDDMKSFIKKNGKNIKKGAKKADKKKKNKSKKNKKQDD